MTILRLCRGLAVLLWLNGCANAPQTDALLSRFESLGAVLSIEHQLDDVPFFPQDAYQCGPAALATVLQASGVNALPEELVARVYVPARQGSLQIEMLAAARVYGRISHVIEPELESLLLEVQSGRPVLVMQNLGISWYPQWHYAVVVGFDLETAKIVLRSGLIRDYEISLSVFERTWQRANRWAVVLLSPGELPYDFREDAYFQSLNDFATVADANALARAYEAGIERWPNSIALAMARGNLYYSEGDLVGARTSYEALLQLSPEYAAAHNNLAQTLLELGQLDLARQHAQQAIQLGGSFRATYRKTLASIEAAEQSR